MYAIKFNPIIFIPHKKTIRGSGETFSNGYKANYYDKSNWYLPNSKEQSC